MCMICAIPELAAKDRWPKPVDAHKPNIALLVTSVHYEYQAWELQRIKDSNLQPTEKLLDTLRLLAKQLDVLEADREAWWTSPEKRQLRKRLEEECDQRKLSELHKINNNTSANIETLYSRLGQFLKWSIGMEFGVSELVHPEARTE